MKKIAKLQGCLAALLVALSTPMAVQAQSAPGAYLTGYRYQMGGLLTGVISPAPSGSGNFPAVRNTYDGNGRLIKVETGVLSFWQADTIQPANWSGFSVSKTQTIAYDSDGRKIQDTFSDSSGIDNVTQYSYDSYNRLQCTAIRMNPAAFGALPSSACVLGTQGSNGPDRITENVYDSLNRVNQVVKAYNTSLQEAYVTYSYTSDGLLKQEIDANGNQTLLTYDGDDRVKQTTFPSKTAPTGYNPVTPAQALATAGSVDSADYEVYGYDSNGNRTSFRKRDGTTIGYSYDALNRMSTKTPPIGNPVYYIYDNRNLVLSQTFSSSTGAGIYYQYDFAGRKTSETNTLFSPSKSVSFLYDNDGDRTRITWPDSYYVAYGFDGVDRMQAACENGSFNGNQASPGCSSGNQLDTYTYDPLQRVASIQYGTGSPAASVGYSWSSWNDLQTLTHTLAGGTGTSYSDSYNRAHQILQATISNAAYNYTSTATGTTNYAPNGLNEYATVAGQTFGYDTNGNLTSDGSHTYSYDSENRLLTAAMAGVSATYLYDPAGRRYQKQVTGGTYAGTTQFVSAGDDEIADYNGSGALLHRYIPGNAVDHPIAQADSSNNRSYFHTDRTGAVVAMSNSSGALTEGPYTYDPYGNCLVGGAACSSATSVAYKYAGRRFDPETGLYYNRARFYSPTLGRFLQTDPVGYKDDMNLYAYVGNDPTDRTDPSGLSACDGTTAGWCITGSWGQAATAVANALPGGANQRKATAAFESGDIVNGVLYEGAALADAALTVVPAAKLAEAAVASEEIVVSATREAAIGVPKPKSGLGRVPQAERDPRRYFSRAERAAKREAQGGECANCGTKIDETNSRGHHIERHADGGRTDAGNHAEVCIDCHDDLHTPE